MMTENTYRGAIENAFVDSIGTSKSILCVGRWSDGLAQRFLSADCALAALTLSREQTQSAMAVCSFAETLDIATTTLPQDLKSNQFDAVVFDGALELYADPVPMLTEIRGLLKADGYAIAALPHIAHGAIRLALMRGIASTYVGVSSSRAAIEMFEQSGYRIREIRRILSPVFGESENLPSMLESDFDPSLVHDVQSDPESQTAAFVMVAEAERAARADVSDDGAATLETLQGGDGDPYSVPFETTLEALRRRTQLEEELRAALGEVGRLRGRVNALEDTLREQSQRPERTQKPRNKP